MIVLGASRVRAARGEQVRTGKGILQEAGVGTFAWDKRVFRRVVRAPRVWCSPPRRMEIFTQQPELTQHYTSLKSS